MRRVFIVQARMASTRLPGKVLLDLAGRPMLAQQLRRLKSCKTADEIVVAATTNAADDPLIELAGSEGVRWFRGSETDVLSRYLGAAREAQAELIVRITSDCPLIDPQESDRVVTALLEAGPVCDYAANILRRTFPRGLDTEAFWRETLERVARLAASQPAREHVTTFLLKEHPELFKTFSVTDEQDNSDLRWTVDTTRDLALMRRLYAELELGSRLRPYREILDHVRRNPELITINADVPQKEV